MSKTLKRVHIPSECAGCRRKKGKRDKNISYTPSTGDDNSGGGRDDQDGPFAFVEEMEEQRDLGFVVDEAIIL